MSDPTHEARRRTATERRRLLIETFSREFDLTNIESAACRFRRLIDAGPPRHMVVSADIDGIVSAAMLAKAAPAWKAVALVWRSDFYYVHPDFVRGLDLGLAFGVDVAGAFFPHVSNHPPLWGKKRVGNSDAAKSAGLAHDEVLRDRARNNVVINPSLWMGIEGSQQDAYSNARSARYRYPLGSTQILLAVLEAIERSPRMFDREYLPWLVANCDGGLATIRQYSYNVPLWWSTMAAAVGPASLSESLYQLAMNQRATEFADAVNRLRAESAGRTDHIAAYLDDDWNILKQAGLAGVANATSWISDISGWPDPFHGGAGDLPHWIRVSPLERGSMPIGMPAGGIEVFKEHLAKSLSAVHASISDFDGVQKLGWMHAWEGTTIPAMPPLPAALQPDSRLPLLE